MKKLVSLSRFAFLALVVFLALIGPSIFADSGANHQVRNTNFGVSGGNVNDISRLFCCSGTLGSLVQANGAQYILSNNHVLARSGQAVAGEDISQPGLVDSFCLPSTIVADFTTAPPLGSSNVDAALAQLRSGAMDATGTIEDIGTISSVVVTPTVGLAVAKSGRTTGYTEATVGSVTTSVSVRYSRVCGSNARKNTFVVSYTNQVVINSSGFSAGGDSGSLVVSGHQGNTCRQPAALLFAGSSTSTVANPIGEVLAQASSALGSAVSFVGSTCTSPAPSLSSAGQRGGPSAESVEFATNAMRQRLDDLMSRPSVIGVGVGASDSDSSEAVIVVYVDQTAATSARLPRRINGVRVKRVYTDPFVAY